MKRFLFASVLAASTLWFSAPASAAIAPPLPAPSASYTQGSLRVDVYGTPRKPAMIFIPGLTCGPWAWAGEIEAFAPDYTIYALTLPGFDGQPAITQPLFPAVSADFWNLLAAQHIEKPIVIGHSLGGTLAIMLAEQHSDRLRAAIAVDGLPIFPGFEALTADQRKLAAQRFASMPGDPAAALPQLITAKSDVDAITPLVRKSDPHAVAQWASEDLMLDLRPQLGKVSIPLLEIGAGAQNASYYPTLLAGDPSAHVVAIENTRHFIMYDQPQALHAQIARFVSSLTQQ
jgi:pimeloyl-ACP methyl ester carboxylesterase